MLKYFILLLLILVVVIALNTSNVSITGGSEKEIIYISYPPGMDYSGLIKEALPKTYDRFTPSSGLEKQINKSKKNTIVIYGTGLREDTMGDINPDYHIHINPIGNLEDIAQNKHNMIIYLKNELLWDKYWSDLWHSKITVFIKPSELKQLIYNHVNRL